MKPTTQPQTTESKEVLHTSAIKTIRELASIYPELYDYHYKWRKTETPELEKDIEEVLYEHGYKFKNEDDQNAGEYNDLKGYLNCEIIPIHSEKPEVLHTQGEWKLGNGGNQYATERNDGFESALVVGVPNGCSVCLGFIWGKTKEESKANAELICKAVNEREKLLDELDSASKTCESINRELVTARNERQRLLDYIGYVENKIGIDEVPMTFKQWKIAEIELR